MNTEIKEGCQYKDKLTGEIYLVTQIETQETKWQTKHKVWFKIIKQNNNNEFCIVQDSSIEFCTGRARFKSWIKK